MWYRFSKKIIKAEDEQDPLGISDIKPTELSDDPYVKKLNALIKSGLMTESEFFDEMTEKRPDLIQNMLSTSHMLLGDLIEPSTNEQFLSREYLELRSAGIDISEAIKMISDGDFSSIEEAFNDFIDRYTSVLAQKASRVTGFQYYEDDITRKFEEKQISLDNLNSTVEDTLAELYYIYKS